MCIIETNFRLCWTAKGQKLEVLQSDGITNITPLIDLKKSYLLDVVEFAWHKDTDEEPIFFWQVPYVLSKRGKIISKVVPRITIITINIVQNVSL